LTNGTILGHCERNRGTETAKNRKKQLYKQLTSIEIGVQIVAVKPGKSCQNTIPGARSGTPTSAGRLSRKLPFPNSLSTASSPANTRTAWNP
jgi:hypothetical protein